MAEYSPYPVPPFLSGEAQAVLAAPMLPTGSPPLDDTESWAQLALYGNAGIRERFGSSDLPVNTRSRDMGGVPVYVIRANDMGAYEDAPIFIDVHGGALVMGGGELAGLMGAARALATGMITWAPDYRMPPLHPFPAALDDVMTVYREALEVRDPSDIVVAGQSAGGNLAAALLLRAKDEGLPMPNSLVLLSPEVDLTESGDSFRTLAAASNTLGSLLDFNRLYAGGADLADPYLSPLFGDVSDFPPTFIQAGTRDLFLSNAVRLHRKLREADVEAELHVWEAMPHGGFPGAPEDLEIDVELRHFLDKHRP